MRSVGIGLAGGVTGGVIFLVPVFVAHFLEKHSQKLYQEVVSESELSLTAARQAVWQIWQCRAVLVVR
jgi:hypothetical protein